MTTDKVRVLITGFGPFPGAPYNPTQRLVDRLVRRDDIQFVSTATPWQWHTPVALASMRAGKHVGSEVPIATSVEDCWALVDESERSRRHCLMMENCCYGNSELTVLRMVREGVFGTLLHAEAAYLHDLRAILFDLSAVERSLSQNMPETPTYSLLTKARQNLVRLAARP